MEKIQVKTKINSLVFVGDKERINFDTLDFSPDQVADINRLIRNNKEDKVKMTIEPENKQLRHAPVESTVRLVSMNCMGAGQKIKIADFHSPSERADTLKRLITSETMVEVTFEQLQGKMFDESEDPDEPGFDDNLPSHESRATIDEPEPKDIELKLPKTWNTNCCIKIGKFDGSWKYSYILKIGNLTFSEPIDECVPYGDLGDCKYNLLHQVNAIIEAQENYKHIKPLKKKIRDAVEEY